MNYMLSKGETAALLSIINAHHGNAQWDDIQLENFWNELMPSMTAAEAKEAVRRFYSSTQGRWCGSGDINQIVKRMRAEAKPSEATICREICYHPQVSKLEPGKQWNYMRQRKTGKTVEQALATVLANPDPLPLPPAKPKNMQEPMRDR